MKQLFGKQLKHATFKTYTERLRFKIVTSFMYSPVSDLVILKNVIKGHQEKIYIDFSEYLTF